MVLNADAVSCQVKRLAHVVINLTGPTGKTPFSRNDQFLTARELEFGSPERLDDVDLVLVLATHTNHGLANVYTSHQTLRLAESASHSSLEPISSSARQHFVDTYNVERVNAKTHVESVFTHELDHVLVGANTGGFQSLGRELFVLIRDHVDTERELIDTSLLTTQIVNTDLWIGDTSAKP